VAQVKAYFETLRAARDAVAELRGTDPALTPPEARAMANADLAVTAGVVKALVENGVLTLAQVQSGLTDALGADGSTWTIEESTDAVGELPSFDDFVPEGFETGPNGATVTALNSSFAGGAVTDPYTAGTAAATFDNTQHYSGTYSLKTATGDGASVAMRSATVSAYNKLHVRFYFRAAAPPATSGCRLYAAQMNPVDGSTEANRWAFEVAVDSAGRPHMYDDGVDQAPGSTPPNICDGTWWRVEALVAYADFYAGTGVELRLYGGADVATTNITFSWTGSYSAGWVDTVLLGQPRSALTSGQSWSAWFDDVDLWIGDWLGP
jgi:hypothetical protein